MEERSLRQCKGDWRPNGEKERVREEARAREGNVHERTGQTSGRWEGERRSEVHGVNERKRWTVFVIKGATRGTASAWKKVSLPSGSSVRHGAVSRMHVEPSIFRVFLPRDSAPSITQHHTNTVRSPVPSGTYQPTPINFGTSLDVQRSEIAVYRVHWTSAFR